MNPKNKWKVEDLAFRQQDMIFRLSQFFPTREAYDLTNQIRRSSRSVGANLAEAYRKTNYPQHFLLKITDADAENSETGYWLLVAVNCNYCNEAEIKEIRNLNDQIGRLLGYMKKNPNQYTFPSK